VAFQGTVQRWDLVEVDLEPHVGREQGGERRPALVVSNDGFNQHFDVVTVLPLTKQQGKARRVYPFEVLLPKGAAGNLVDSTVMPHQVRTISKLRLLARRGRLEDVHLRAQVEDRLLDHFGISFETEDQPDPAS
jgi:mRNA-degrading endonuclease toxin of MazEF toxin-antitoxin module